MLLVKKNIWLWEQNTRKKQIQAGCFKAEKISSLPCFLSWLNIHIDFILKMWYYIFISPLGRGFFLLIIAATCTFSVLNVCFFKQTKVFKSPFRSKSTTFRANWLYNFSLNYYSNTICRKNNRQIVFSVQLRLKKQFFWNA